MERSPRLGGDRMRIRGCISREEGIMSVRGPRTVIMIGLMFLGWSAAPGRAQTASVEPRAGTWKTHVLTSGSELRLPSPPDAASTRAEAGELRALGGQRTAAQLDQINYWDAGPPGYRWNEIAMSQGLKHIAKIGPSGNYRMMTLLNVAIYDATIEYRWDQNPPRAARAYALASIASFDEGFAIARKVAARALEAAIPADRPFVPLGR